MCELFVSMQRWAGLDSMWCRLGRKIYQFFKQFWSLLKLLFEDRFICFMWRAAEKIHKSWISMTSEIRSLSFSRWTIWFNIFNFRHLYTNHQAFLDLFWKKNRGVFFSFCSINFTWLQKVLAFIEHENPFLFTSCSVSCCWGNIELLCQLCDSAREICCHDPANWALNRSVSPSAY